ncbi:VPLPA-CTERM sorting domain-containing protein [Litorivita sp. NS0012-18]|uniref:VPLPA-CTERM sorting domain-containing protein n=1 Tax=Litorivita sp. NS0012-18 TaxID=3127655 RepID=UPI003105052E
MKHALSLVGATAVAALLAVSPASALTLDAGWEVDTLLTADFPSEDSPYTFTLTDDAYFRLTDAFLTGDVFGVYQSGVLLAETTLTAFASGFGDNFSADSAWTSADYGSLELLLGAGSYNLIVIGDGGGGTPADFYVRLDSAPAVPLPASLPLLALGVAGFGMMKRRKKS